MGKLLCGFDRLLKTIRLWLGLCSTVGPIEKRLGPERGGGRCKKGPKECWGGGGHIEALGVRTWHWAWYTAGHFGGKDGQELRVRALVCEKKPLFPELLPSFLID